MHERPSIKEATILGAATLTIDILGYQYVIQIAYASDQQVGVGNATKKNPNNR